MVTDEALNYVECLPVLNKLDREPILEELNEALDALALVRLSRQKDPEAKASQTEDLLSIKINSGSLLFTGQIQRTQNW